MDAIIFGSIICDITIFEKEIKKTRIGKRNYLILEYGSKLDINKLEFNNGGSGHNIAYGLAKLERKVGLIGCIGNDIFGEKIFNDLNSIGVETSYVKKINKPTGLSIILIGKDGERSILISRGANDYIEPKQIDKDYISNSKFFVFTSVVGKKSISALSRGIKYAKRADVRIVANPSESMIKSQNNTLKKFIKLSDIVIMNEKEATLLTNKKSDSALLSIKNMGPSIVVITRGENGVIAIQNKNQYIQKSYDVIRKDTTGAGDAFTTGFLHSLMRKDSFEYALKFGCACSAINIQSYGAVKDFPTEDDIIKMIGEKNV